MSIKRLFDLSGRTALVTGSSRGIGRAIALGLAEYGADVVFHYAGRKDEAEAAAHAATQLGVRAFVVQGNMAEADAPRHVFDAAVRHLGRLDILVPNVSVQVRAPWPEVTPDDFDWQIRVNLRSSMELMQLALPGMMERRWGRVLTIGSVQQVKPHPAMLVYAASKCALVSMVQNLAKQVAPYGVTVNNLAPGVIATDRNSEALSDAEYRQLVLSRIPAETVGQSEDCVGVALVLCSDAGRYVTGEDWLVDGGMHLA